MCIAKKVVSWNIYENWQSFLTVLMDKISYVNCILMTTKALYFEGRVYPQKVSYFLKELQQSFEIKLWEEQKISKVAVATTCWVRALNPELRIKRHRSAKIWWNITRCLNIISIMLVSIGETKYYAIDLISHLPHYGKMQIRHSGFGARTQKPSYKLIVVIIENVFWGFFVQLFRESEHVHTNQPGHESLLVRADQLKPLLVVQTPVEENNWGWIFSCKIWSCGDMRT